MRWILIGLSISIILGTMVPDVAASHDSQETCEETLVVRSCEGSRSYSYEDCYSGEDYTYCYGGSEETEYERIEVPLAYLEQGHDRWTDNSSYESTDPDGCGSWSSESESESDTEYTRAGTVFTNVQVERESSRGSESGSYSNECGEPRSDSWNETFEQERVGASASTFGMSTGASVAVGERSDDEGNCSRTARAYAYQSDMVGYTYVSRQVYAPCA